jgi:hypothetical protein
VELQDEFAVFRVFRVLRVCLRMRLVAVGYNRWIALSNEINRSNCYMSSACGDMTCEGWGMMEKFDGLQFESLRVRFSS